MVCRTVLAEVVLGWNPQTEELRLWCDALERNPLKALKCQVLGHLIKFWSVPWHPVTYNPVTALHFLARFYPTPRLSDNLSVHVVICYDLSHSDFTVTFSILIQNEAMHLSLKKVYNSRKTVRRIVVSYFCLHILKYILLNGLYAYSVICVSLFDSPLYFWSENNYLISFSFLLVNASLTWCLVFFLKFCCYVTFFFPLMLQQSTK